MIVLADQFTKFLVTRSLALNLPVVFINPVVYFTLVHNRGAAFGIMKNQTPVFIITSVVAISLIIAELRKKCNPVLSLYNISLGLILGGALGNLIDRLLFGYVIDFIDLRFWPVFNVADSSITIGACIFAFQILFGRPRLGKCRNIS